MRSTENLKVAPQWYGAFETVFGLGLVAGALGASAIGARTGYRALYAVGVSLTGMGMIVGSRLTELWPELIVLLFVGIPAAMSHVAFTPLLLEVVPSTHQSRVLAVISPAEHLAALAGGVGAGWLTSTMLVGFRAEIAGVRFGRIDTVLAAAGALVLMSGLYAWRALRNPAGLTDHPVTPSV
ncbi:hypothetical protein GCM10011609_85720 [Lentzea pudingi]|uniref:Major facilitator superfamily (MFS) profile domain-containing protein n=1 Tax=Lentzea pudingi TaxID=1789439 RepID=A0ABQ2ISI7_9PSEU|nr:hypothetical protein [Lentzea pudingi]GGN29007.1 hypothetical protein GCM10011609_85720 [Lentzea pudingi]